MREFDRKWSADDANLLLPLRWRKSRNVRISGDLFHESIPDEWIDRVFAVMALCPQHTFQVLTKRAERMREYCERKDRRNEIELAAEKIRAGTGWCAPKHSFAWPLPNVWLGISAERQQEADERIPHLLNTPAAIRFVSAEPLLGPIDFGDRLKRWHEIECDLSENQSRNLVPNVRLDWIITGGESGPHARPALIKWPRSIRDQCQESGVAYFHKQNGEWIDADEWLGGIERGPSQIIVDGKPWQPATPLNYTDAADLACFTGRSGKHQHQSDGSTMIRVGKHAAGRTLDGKEYSEFPKGVS